MKKLIYISFILWNTNFALAQNKTNTIELASKALTEKDTLGTIHYLEQFGKQNPQNTLCSITNMRLAEFYLKGNQLDSVTSKLKAIVNFIPNNFIPDSAAGEITQGAKNIFKPNDYFATTNYFFIQSQLATKNNNSTKALSYLKIAYSICLEQGCGNAINNELTYLSTKYASYYLETGDTSKAINKLLDYFLAGESESVASTKMLKEILLYKYTKEQISNNIENGIKNSKLSKKDYKSSGNNYLNVILFEHLIKVRARKEINLERERLKNNYYIKYLQN